MHREEKKVCDCTLYLSPNISIIRPKYIMKEGGRERDQDSDGEDGRFLGIKKIHTKEFKLRERTMPCLNTSIKIIN